MVVVQLLFYLKLDVVYKVQFLYFKSGFEFVAELG